MSTFTEEKRLAILEFEPRAERLRYTSKDLTVIDYEIHYTLPIKGNKYGLEIGTEIDLTKPIKELTKKDLLEGLVVRFIDFKQENHFREDVCDWSTDYPISKKPSFLWVENGAWAMSNSVSSTDGQMITYEKGCEIVGIEPIKPTLEDMKDYAIECGSVPKCDAVKDFVRANGGEAYENGSQYKYIINDRGEFTGCMDSKGKTVITFPDAQKKWGIPDPKVQTRRMTTIELADKWLDIGDGGLSKVTQITETKPGSGKYPEVVGVERYKDHPTDTEWKSAEVEA